MMVVKQFPASELQARMATYSPLPSPDINLSNFDDDGATGNNFFLDFECVCLLVVFF